MFIEYCHRNLTKNMCAQMKRLVCVAVLYCAAFSVALAADSCLAAEEGTPHNITCDFNETAIGPQFHLLWSADVRNIEKNVSKCGFAKCETISGFMVTTEKSTSTLLILNVSRDTPFNVETKWRCGGRTICTSLRVFARPKKVNCEFLPLNASSNHVSMKCIAERVYPQAYCTGSISTDNTKFKEITTILGSRNTSWNETPVYYTSECALQLQLQYFRTGDNFIKVKMYSNIPGGTKYGVDSETYLITVDIHPSRATSSFWSSSNSVITLGVACAIAICAAVLLGILALSYRRKYKLLERGTEKIPKTKAPQDVPPGYNKTDMSEPDDEASSEVYEEMADTFRTPSSRPKTVNRDQRNNVYQNSGRL